MSPLSNLLKSTFNDSSLPTRRKRHSTENTCVNTALNTERRQTLTDENYIKGKKRVSAFNSVDTTTKIISF